MASNTTFGTNYTYGDNGVIIPDTADIQTTVQTEYQTALGSGISLEESTPQGRLIDTETTARANTIAFNAAVANILINISTATGAALDAKEVGSPVGKAIQDITNTKFAKADRIFTSHKVKDFAEDISSGNSEIQKAIEDYLSDDRTFDFDELSAGTRGRTDSVTGNITINSNMPLEKQMATMKHETVHVLQKEIAEACGKDSVEYKIYQEGVQANKAIHDFEAINPDNVKQWDKWKKLEKDNLDKADDYIDSLNLDDYERVMQYDGLFDRYHNSQIETEARNASNGDWKFFGKEIKDYGENLRQIHGNGTKKIRKGNTSEVKGNAQGRGREISKGTQGNSKNDVRPHSDVQRPDSGSSATGFLESKEPPLNKPGKQELAPVSLAQAKSTSEIVSKTLEHQEEIKLEFDLITESQAKNRKTQSSGVYIKRKYRKQDGSIDLTKDYNEGRRKKVGQFGKRSFVGVDKNKTIKDILIDAKKDEVKTQHLKDSINFVESEFAKPLPKSGNVDSGYVAVNRNLLANAVWGKKTTEWYKMMERGEDAIKETFKNERVAEAWIKLAERNSKPDYQIPKQVFEKLFDGSGETAAEYWERYGTKQPVKAIAKTAGSILDVINNSFKRGVLTSSSFVFNNRYGNQMMIAAKSNPVEYIKSFYQASRLKDKDLPSELIESSILEAVGNYNVRQTYTGWQPLDNFCNLFSGHLINTETLKTMKKSANNAEMPKTIENGADSKKTTSTHNIKSLAAGAVNVCIGLPNKAFGKVCDKLMKFNEAFERFERKQVYGIQMDRVKKDLVKKTGQRMISHQEVLKHIKSNPEIEETIIKNIEDTLGDYNNFNNFERKVLKRVVPFYSWYRTITRHTISLAKENPTRCALIFIELQRLKEKDQDLKEWQQGSIRTGIQDKRSQKELLINKVAQIPYNTFEEFSKEGGKGGLSPGIKTPLESVRGKHFFNDSEITSRRYLKTTKEYGARAKSGYLDKKTGKFKEGGLPFIPRLGFLGKEALKTMYPALQSPLAKVEATTQGVARAINKGDIGEYLEPDKIYDSGIGGYYKDEPFSGDKKRWAANDISQQAKWANRFLGLSLQNKQKLNKSETKARKEKWLRQKKRRIGD